MSGLRASARLIRVAGFCNQWGLDLTVGCAHACAYCRFQTYQALTLGQEYDGLELARSLALDQFLQLQNYPRVLYLSPFTDPAAPAARENLERVLERVLPLNVTVILSTKGIIPTHVFRLLAWHPELIRLIIGVTSLDERRNAVVEPGCPSAAARLENLRLAREFGLTNVTARLDPVLPGVDDAAEKLLPLLDRIAHAGTQAVTASYLFVSLFGNRERLRRTEYLGPAIDACTELCPIEAGSVYSVPLERKREFFDWINRECAARGMLFGTCGCKDLRLAQQSGFPTACTYPFFARCCAASLADRAGSDKVSP
jgi:DNA repair photolyase